MAARIKANSAYDYDYEDDEDENNNGLILTALHLALRPIRPFISRPAIRAYLTTIFAFVTAFALLGLATIAYSLFYNLYVPRIGFSRPLHLQYDHILINQRPREINTLTVNPWAITSLSPDITSSQPYDITLELTLPYTPSNREAGNFMLDIQLLAPSSPLPATMTTSTTTLAQARLPALLPYRSRVVHLTQTLLSLPYYIFGLRSESTTLSVPVFSRVDFPQGWKTTPSTLRLEVQSIHVLQIEKVKVHFRARMRGLRWWMYNWKVLSAVVFVGLFWGVECFFAALAWGVLAVYFSSSSQEATKEPKAQLPPTKHGENSYVKEEPMSDTERTFPSRTGSGLVRYSSPDLKKEVKEEEVENVEMLAVPEHVARASEADVEDEGEEEEEVDFDDDDDLDFRDSGIGTSLENEASWVGRRNGMRRRLGERGRKESKD